MKDRDRPSVGSPSHAGSQAVVERCSSAPSLTGSAGKRGKPGLDLAETVASSPELSCPSGRSRSSIQKARKKRQEHFFERNDCAPQTDLRRKLAIMQRRLNEAVSKHEESFSVNWGNQGAEGFRKWLKSRFGTVPNAWRTALDPHGHWKLSFGELCLCCQRMGFSCNFKRLWNELDANKTGFVTLAELDAEASQALSDFRQLCLDQFGSTLNAWHQGFNPQGAPYISEQQFVDKCKAAGYAGDGAKLFHWLRTEPSRKVLMLKDFDPRTAAALMRADPLAESLSLGDTSRACCSPAPRALQLSPLDGRPLTSPGLGDASSPCSMASTLDLRSSGGMSASLTRCRTAPTPLRAAGAEAATPSSSPSHRKRSAAEKASGEEAGEATAREESPGQDQQELEGTTSATNIAGLVSASQSVRGSTVNGGTLRTGVFPPTTVSSEWTRELSATQISDRIGRQNEEDAINYGLKNPEELKVGLARRYGSLFAAWTELLDPVGKGKVPFMEFCERIREVGYNGDMKQLWAFLGCVPTGNCVRFRDLDPAFDALLSKFRGTMKEKHGNMLSAWKNAFDPHDNGRIDEASFVRQCQRDGFDGDAALIFRTLQGRGKGKLMTLQAFDPASFHALVRGDDKMLFSEHERRDIMSMSFEERQASMLGVKWTAEVSAAQRALTEMQRTENSRFDKGCDNTEALRAYLIRKYGSLTAAWRCCLDPMNQGKLSFEAFTQAIRQRVGYTGSYPKLWADLVKPDAPCILLHDWDPEAAEVLWDFRVWLLQKFGDIIAAWKKGLDPHGHQRLEEGTFKARVQQLGYPGDAVRVFDLLKADRERHFITHSDIDGAAAQACWRDDREGWTVGGVRSGPNVSPREWPGRASRLGSSQSPEQLQQQNGVARHTKVTMWSEKLGHQHRDGLYKAEKDARDRMVGVKNVDGFRHMLSERYGSSLAGWRYILDPEFLGRLTFGNFRDGLQRLGGWTGNMKAIWSELDAKGYGFVSFADYDPDVSAVLDEFREFLLGRFPCLVHAWHLGLDAEGVEQLNEAAFLQNCADMQLAWDRKKLLRLYRLLLPERNSGRKLVQVEDLRVLLLMVPRGDRRIIWQGAQTAAGSPPPQQPPQQQRPRAETPTTPAGSPKHRDSPVAEQPAPEAVGIRGNSRHNSRTSDTPLASSSSAPGFSSSAEGSRSTGRTAGRRAERRPTDESAPLRSVSAGSMGSDASTRHPDSPSKAPSRRRAKLESVRQEARRQEQDGQDKEGGGDGPQDAARHREDYETPAGSGSQQQATEAPAVLAEG